MGLTRKIMSVSTMGAVDFRSDKERTAAYAKTAADEARKQTKILKKQAAAEFSTGQPSGLRRRGLPKLGSSAGDLSAPAAPTLAEQLAELGRLRDAGHLTDAEFDAAKAKLLT